MDPHDQLVARVYMSLGIYLGASLYNKDWNLGLGLGLGNYL